MTDEDRIAEAMFQEAVLEQARRNLDAVEAVCEAMLTTPGDRGVLVTKSLDGAVVAELSTEVPFGELHYRPAGPEDGSCWAKVRLV